MAANLVLNLSQPKSREGREHVYHVPKQPPNTGAGVEGRTKQGFLTRRDMSGSTGATGTGVGTRTQKRVASGHGRDKEASNKDPTIPRDSLILDIDPSRYSSKQQHSFFR